MARELERIATMCDGVRCDMAMLILPDVFERTWGMRPEPFWPRTIERVRKAAPSFLFMAEVYWDLEWELQQQGFNYTYDKRLYDRLVEGHARPVREHFRANIDFQQRSARFLENHDEPRAAGTFDRLKHEAAAVLTFLCPGLRFIHQGQMRDSQSGSPCIWGVVAEEVDADLHSFYQKLLGCVHRDEARNGEWMFARPAAKVPRQLDVRLFHLLRLGEATAARMSARRRRTSLPIKANAYVSSPSAN